MVIGKRTKTALALASSMLCLEQLANASTNQTGTCDVKVRRPNFEEIRTTVELDFEKPVLADKTLAILPSGEKLRLYVSEFTPDLFMSILIEDSGGQVFELNSVGKSLFYENYRDPNFVLISVGCFWH